MKRRYPLEALRKVRHQAVDDRAVELSARMQAREQAERVHASARRAREQERARAARVTASERARLEAGGARVADLQSGLAWRAGASERERALEQADARSRVGLEQATNDEAEARRALAAADADAKTVEEHRERWRRDEELRAERAEEEAANENWSGQHARGKRPGKRG